MSGLPPFSMVPTGAWSDPRLLESDLRVLGALCSFYNPEAQACWPSHRAIQKRTPLSIGTVKNALNRLRDLGYIDWQPREADKNAGRLSNIYEINYSDEAWL